MLLYKRIKHTLGKDAQTKVTCIGRDIAIIVDLVSVSQREFTQNRGTNTWRAHRSGGIITLLVDLVMQLTYLYSAYNYEIFVELTN